MLRSVLGVVAALAALGALTAGAVALRRRCMPTLSGPPAWLADGVAVVATVVTVSEVLGTVHGFRVGVLTAVLIAGGGVAWYVGRSGGRPAAAAPDPSDEVPTRTGPVAKWVAIGAAGVLVAEWVPRLIRVYRTGPLTIDSLWYHLPIAARFVQTGETLGLTFVSGGGSLPTFYPHTSELLHAVGIVFVGHDTLTPLLNAVWLAVALFSAWCIGRAFGVGALTFTAVAVVLGGPQLVMYEAGQAINDLFGVAMTLAAMSMLVHTWRRASFPAGVVYAGLAMGLALSSKFTVVGPAAALTIALVVFFPRGQRIRLGALWLAALVVTGGFWFLRNLIAVGNPVPPLEVSLGPIELPSVQSFGVSTIWSHLFEGTSWTRDFLPGFRYAMGPVWWAVLAIVFGGLVVGTVKRAVDQRIRLMAIVGLASFVIFLFSPQTLGFFGATALFKYQVRYMVITFALGATVAATLLSRAGRRVTNTAAVGFGVVLLASQIDDMLWPASGAKPPELGLPTLSTPELAAGIAAGLGVVLLLTGWMLWRRSGREPSVSRSTLVGGLLVGAVIVVVAFFALQHVYQGRRYAHAPFLTKTYRWARDTTDARVGLVGVTLQYPLAGKDLSNHVSFLDARTHDLEFAPPIRDCATWRRTINRRRLDYVLITTQGYPLPAFGPAPERAWTETDPAARLVRTEKTGSAGAWVYRLHGRLDPAGCPSVPPG